MNRSRLIRRVTERRTTGPIGAVAAVLLLVGLLGIAPAAGQGSVDDGQITAVADIAPDVTLIGLGATIEDPASLVADLVAVDGVTRAVIDTSATPDPLVHLAVATSGPGGRPLDTVVAQASAVLDASELGATSVVAGGSAIEDQALADRYGRSSAWLAWLAIVIGLAFGLVEGWRRGLLTAAGLGVAVVAASSIGSQAAGQFQGSMSGTGLPAAAAGLVIAVALAARLLVWFRDPTGVDGASQIQGAVRDLGPELVLLFAGLAATALIVDPLDPGRSAITVGAVGAGVAAVVTLAVLAPGLVLIRSNPDRTGPDRLPFSLPDGRNLGLPVIALAGLALAILSVAAFGRVDLDLPDGSDLDDGAMAQVAAAQAARGGDPTTAFAATGGGAALVDLAGWAAAAAERPDVAWIDVDGQRHTSTGANPIEDWASLAPEGSAVAVIVPAVAIRSAEGPVLVAGLNAIPLAGDGLELDGRGADIGGVAGSRGTVLAAVLSLAAMAGLATIILTGNRALGLVSFGLRVLLGGATVGVHNLVASDPSMASILTTLIVVGVGSLASELELLRRLESESETAWSDPAARHWSPVPGPLASNAGQYGGLGLGALVVAGPVLLLAAATGGGPDTSRLAVALLLSALIDIGVGAAVLRPALLGQRAAYQRAARPLRIVAHARSTGDPASDTPPDDDPAWREVVIDLIQTEFWLQTEPADAELDRVFASDTPVLDQASERHDNLARSGLRVVGQPPELQSLRTNRDRQPTIVTVTVDHPASQLLDPTGRVVGVRRPERRIGRLWLSSQPGGGHRIAESIELGTSPLREDSGGEPAPTDHGFDSRPLAEDPAG